MKALIIEDEQLAAQSLQSLISEVSDDIEVIGILQTIDESIEWFRQNPMPDLIFLDIHLADGSSFSIFEEVDVSCPIIFTTAYDEYALKAFEVNSIDYLLKPISKADLERAIHKFEHLSSGKENSELIRKLLLDLNKDNYKSYFLVSEKDKLIPLPIKEVACIYIDTKMVKALTHSGKGYYMDRNLDELMHELDPSCFYRANRQYIVSKEAVKDISLWFHNKLSINLYVQVPERILVSKARVGEFKRWFVK